MGRRYGLLDASGSGQSTTIPFGFTPPKRSAFPRWTMLAAPVGSGHG